MRYGPCILYIYTYIIIFKTIYTLPGTNTSHLVERKIIFKSALVGDMLVPGRVDLEAMKKGSCSSPTSFESWITLTLGQSDVGQIEDIPTLPLPYWHTHHTWGTCSQEIWCQLFNLRFRSWPSFLPIPSLIFEKQQGVRRKQALLEARSDVDVQDKGPELRV